VQRVKKSLNCQIRIFWRFRTESEGIWFFHVDEIQSALASSGLNNAVKGPKGPIMTEARTIPFATATSSLRTTHPAAPHPRTARPSLSPCPPQTPYRLSDQIVTFCLAPAGLTYETKLCVLPGVTASCVQAARLGDSPRAVSCVLPLAEMTRRCRTRLPSAKYR
jgi:hypothetical protein